MTDDVAISVNHVSKSFKLPHEKHTSIKSALINLGKSKRGYEKQQVLQEISFEIKKGEFFGIVGRNGSGKSTLLKMLAGIYVPTEGDIQVNGKLTPFIELGVGFNPELTGRENVFLNGALLGFNRKEMEVMYDEIVQFAELERFMDQKLKNYSSGMQVRLAFSIAVRANSDILVLDEVLAVGDAAFQRRCYDYFMSLKGRHQTVVLVTHDMNAVRQYCDRAIMIEKGRIVRSGDAEEVAQDYQKLFIENEGQSPTENKGDVWGEGGLSIDKVHSKVSDNSIHIATTFKATQNLPPPIYGFTLYNQAGTNILEANTRKEEVQTKALVKGDKVTIDWEFPNILSDGSYTLSVACCDQSVTRYYEWVNHASSFKIVKYKDTAGVVNPLIKVGIK